MKSECWIWQGAISGGYGEFSFMHKVYKAHRISLEYFYSRLLTEVERSLDIMHLCSNKACANPDHLVLATRSENMIFLRDIEGNPRGKLNQDQVSLIRNLYSNGGHTTRSLAQQFKVCQTTIFEILHREIWA